jgi:hypothetical protein
MDSESFSNLADEVCSKVNSFNNRLPDLESLYPKYPYTTSDFSFYNSSVIQTLGNFSELCIATRPLAFMSTQFIEVCFINIFCVLKS